MPRRLGVRPRTLLALWVGLGLGVGMFETPLRAAGGSVATVSAENIKAAFLLNFMRFTDWPPAADGEFSVLGVVGDRALEDALFALADSQTVHERRLRVVRVRSVRDALDCHLVFFGASSPTLEGSAPSPAEILAALARRPILTVGDEPGFLDLGGTINFYREGEKLRFEIAPEAVGAGGLVMSSRLLALARIARRPTAVQP